MAKALRQEAIDALNSILTAPAFAQDGVGRLPHGVGEFEDEADWQECLEWQAYNEPVFRDHVCPPLGSDLGELLRVNLLMPIVAQHAHGHPRPVPHDMVYNLERDLATVDATDGRSGRRWTLAQFFRTPSTDTGLRRTAVPIPHLGAHLLRILHKVMPALNSDTRAIVAVVSSWLSTIPEPERSRSRSRPRSRSRSRPRSRSVSRSRGRRGRSGRGGGGSGSGGGGSGSGRGGGGGGSGRGGGGSDIIVIDDDDVDVVDVAAPRAAVQPECIGCAEQVASGKYRIAAQCKRCVMCYECYGRTSGVIRCGHGFNIPHSGWKKMRLTAQEAAALAAYHSKGGRRRLCRRA